MQVRQQEDGPVVDPWRYNFESFSSCDLEVDFFCPLQLVQGRLVSVVGRIEVRLQFPVVEPQLLAGHLQFEPLGLRNLALLRSHPLVSFGKSVKPFHQIRSSNLVESERFLG